MMHFWDGKLLLSKKEAEAVKALLLAHSKSVADIHASTSEEINEFVSAWEKHVGPVE